MATVDNNTQQTAPPGTATASTINSLEVLDRRLKEAIQQSAELRPLLNQLLRLTSEVLGSHYVGYFENNQGDEMVPTQCLSPKTEDPETLRQLAVDVDDLKVVTAAAAMTKAVVNQPLAASPALVGMAAPVANPGRLPAALAAIVPANDPALRRKMALLDHVAGAISQWRLMSTLERLNWEAGASSAAVELMTEVIGSNSLHEAYISAANALKNLFACERVIIAAYQPELGKHEIQAISEMAQFDPNSATVQAVAAAMDEAVFRDDLTVWPPLTPQQRHATLAHRRLAEVGKEEAIVTSPLSVDDEIVGAVMFLGRRTMLHVARRIDGIRAMAPHLAAALVARGNAEPSRLKQVFHEIFGRPGTKQRRYSWMLILLLGAIMPLVPWRHQVKTDCKVEPVVRRFTVTPYEGILQKGLVEPGDLVREGEVIARMDDRELRWKLASLGADLVRASKERDAAMAKHDTSEKQIAVLKMESLKSEIELYQHRQRNLEITSPIAGVVLKGDLEDAEGSPVKTGQTLYEIAPLSPLKVELAIPEEDLPQTKPGMSVAIRLDGFAGGALKGKIARIHPRSEIQDAENVFIAEFELDNEDGKLRPGMSGRARVRSGIRPLGWIWFHKAWHRTRLLIGY